MFTLIIIAVIGLWFYGKHRIKRAVAHVEQQMTFSDQSMNGSRRDAFDQKMAFVAQRGPPHA